MADSLDRLGETLSRFVGNVRPSTQLFNEIDVTGIAKELELEQKGSERGKANQPQQTSTTFDAPQNEVVSKVTEHVRSGYQTFVDEMRVYSERIRQLEIEQRVSEISLATQDTISNFRSRVHTGRDDLFVLARTIKQTEEEVEDFKREHGLRRTPHPPESHILHIGTLALILIIETALNGNFLAQGLSGGWTAGFVSALVIALLNVGFGFLFGYFSCEIWHKSSVRRMFGKAAIILQIVFVFAFNLFVAHYREALANVDPEAAVKLAVQAYKSSPLGLSDFESWILAGMGILFSIIAFIDGVKWDDPYPGYGKVAKKNIRAHDYYNAEKQGLIDELKEFKDNIAETMSVATDDMSKRKREYFDVVEYQKRLCSAFKSHLDQVETATNHLLSIYRDANRASRKEQAPKYFDSKYELERPENIEPDTPPYTAQQINALMKRADDAIKKSTDQLYKEFDRASTSFREVEEIVTGEKNVAAEETQDA